MAVIDKHYAGLSEKFGYEIETPEYVLNQLGYSYLGEKEINKAIKVFKENVKRYPKSANVYDSLGEAYMKSGDKELAIKNYRRSLELNPRNENAKHMLKKLAAD